MLAGAGLGVAEEGGGILLEPRGRVVWGLVLECSSSSNSRMAWSRTRREERRALYQMEMMIRTC